MHAMYIASMLFSFAALALGDPSVTIEKVAPAVYPSETLFPSEVGSQIVYSCLFCLNYYFMVFISVVYMPACSLLAGKFDSCLLGRKGSSNFLRRTHTLSSIYLM